MRSKISLNSSNRRCWRSVIEGMPSNPARKFAGMASSPWTSIAKSTPVSSIALRTQRTSGLFSSDGACHSRLRFVPTALVRRCRVLNHLGSYWEQPGKCILCAERVPRIILVGQFLERAFHPPFRHAFARVLASVEPGFDRPVADRQAIDVLAIKFFPSDRYSIPCSAAV